MKKIFRPALKAAVLLAAMAAAAADCRAGYMDGAPSATVRFSDGSKKHLNRFAINGCLYRGISTGMVFRPGMPVVLSIATEKGGMELPVTTLKKITFTLTNEKSSCGAPVFEVKVSRFKAPALAGWTNIGSIWEDKTKWGLDQYKKDQLPRLKTIESLVFDPPPGEKGKTPAKKKTP